MQIPEGPYCQSCGAPLKQVAPGTEKSGKKSEEYCQFCYKDGAFIEPNLKLEEMQARAKKILVEQMGVPEFQAGFVTSMFIPGLKRWQK